MNSEAFNQLNEKEQALVLRMLKEMSSGNTDLYNQLMEVDYRETPVSPEEFLNNEKYLGKIGKHLYDLWRRDFISIYSNPMIYHVILTGAIGIGKDFFTEILLMMELYKIACLKDPHAYFNLAPNTDIVISLISITKSQTKAVLFNQLKSMIDCSDWFTEHFPRNKDKNDVIEFRSPADDGSGKYGRIRVMYGAPTNSSVIGENVITAVMDEANFMQVIEKSKKIRGLNKEFNQAQMVYDNLIRRMKSRYLKGGKLAGKIILLSSRQYPDDFVEVKINELKDDSCVKICAYSLYEMKPDRYSKKDYFWVLIGNKQVASRMLMKEDIANALSIDTDDIVTENITFEFLRENIFNETESSCDIERVPIDFKHDYEVDLDGSIRDISGKATLTVESYLKQRDRLYKCFKKEIVNMLLNKAELTTFEDGEILDADIIASIPTKHLPHAIHLDLSTSPKTENSTGFAMSHVAALVEKTHNVRKSDGMGNEHLASVTEMLPLYRTDIMLEIRPPKNEELRLSLVRQLIFDLREHGFNIAIVTADQYQSKDTLQILADNGFETAHLSVDTSYEPYDNLKFAIYEERWESYEHAKFTDEILHLEDDVKNHKINHRSGKCFAGDTKIKMLDGTYVSFEELANSDKKEFWVYSCKEDGTIVPAKAHNCRITDTVNELIEIELDNGKKIRCTLTHPFMLRNGKYKLAKDLTPEDSLMPLRWFTCKSKYSKLSGYEMIYDNGTNNRQFTHTMVSKHFGKNAENGKTVIHHYDINKRNNVPDNLILLTIAEHAKVHSSLNELGKCKIKERVATFKKRYWSDKSAQERRSASAKARYTEEVRKKASERMKEKNKNNPNLHKEFVEKSRATKIKNGNLVTENNHKFAERQRSPEGRKRSSEWAKNLNETYWKSEEGKNRRKELSKTVMSKALAVRLEKEELVVKENIEKYRKYLCTHSQAMRLFGGGYEQWKERIKRYNVNVAESVKNVKNSYEKGEISLEEIGLTKRVYDCLLRKYNHKIISSRIIKLDTPINVYDIEVPIYDNFALEAGVFVHNSKDVTDAVAGSCWSLSKLKLWDDGGQLIPTKGLMKNSPDAPVTAITSCDDFEAEFAKNHLKGTPEKEEEELTLEKIMLFRKGVVK